MHPLTCSSQLSQGPDRGRSGCRVGVARWMSLIRSQSTESSWTSHRGAAAAEHRALLVTAGPVAACVDFLATQTALDDLVPDLAARPHRAVGAGLTDRHP